MARLCFLPTYWTRYRGTARPICAKTQPCHVSKGSDHVLYTYCVFMSLGACMDQITRLWVTDLDPGSSGQNAFKKVHIVQLCDF